MAGANLHKSADYCDDGETNAGCALLTWMLGQNLQNIAVFIVRFQGNQKLGTDRYKCIQQAAESTAKAAGFTIEQSTEVQGTMADMVGNQAEGFQTYR